jgi:ACS family hexuronate transporter-like MFS transporter
MLSRQQAWPVAVVAVLTMTVSYADRQTLSALAPTLRDVLHMSKEDYGWLMSAFSFAYLFASPLAGWWIDRIGARRGLVASVLAWSTVAALHAVVPGFATLFALRLALGVTEGPSFPGAVQTIQRVLPPADRSRGLGFVFSGSSLGAMIAPQLAGFLFDQAGWRLAFLGSAAVGLVWVPLWLALTNRRSIAAQLDTPSEATREKPRYIDLASHPAMIRALLAIFAVAPAIGFVLYWTSDLLVKQLGVPQGDVGHYLWLPPLCLDAGAIAFGDLLARTRKPHFLFALAALLTTTLALLPLVATPWQVIAIGGVTVAGGGAIYTLVTAELLSAMPPQIASSAGGLVACGQSLSLIITNPLIGRVADSYGSYDIPAVALAVWVLPGAVAWWAWRPRGMR